MEITLRDKLFQKMGYYSGRLRIWLALSKEYPENERFAEQAMLDARRAARYEKYIRMEWGQ